jgi:RNA polymerase sigma-70 factor (ECF subfamily)
MDESPTQAEWRQWLEDHAPRFLLFARQQARCEADAQDLVQEAVVEAAGRQRNGTPPPPALIFATLRRRAIDLARREDRRTGREQAALEPMPEAWFDTSVEDREHSQLIQDAMSRLPDLYREVITLKVWGGLTFAEIAAALGIPANTAASRYRYGLAELRKLTKEVLA